MGVYVCINKISQTLRGYMSNKETRPCSFCNKPVTRYKSNIKFHHSTNLFCNKICQTDYRKYIAKNKKKICKFCKQEFSVINNRKVFCDRECEKKSRGYIGGYVNVNCSYCNNIVKKKRAELNRGKYKKSFCNKKCAAIYNNRNYKLCGKRISKPELYFQNELLKLYRNINFIFNGKEAIKGELDIYIPNLKLAFELNGIFHYEPIHGQEALDKVQNNDKRKFQACIEYGIELVIMDTSSIRYIKPEKMAKFLKIMTDIIDSKLSNLARYN